MVRLYGSLQNFNPRSPCGERLGLRITFFNTNSLFQSTLPVWGATRLDKIYPVVLHISIHAPRVGSDPSNSGSTAEPLSFQSTLPVWGATPVCSHLPCRTGISIHAPRVGSDPPTVRPWPLLCHDFNPRSPCGERRPIDGCPGRTGRNFNPRSPCGERQQYFHRSTRFPHFNPRSPCGERRRHNGRSRHDPLISIHAPRVGSDVHALIPLNPSS